MISWIGFNSWIFLVREITRKRTKQTPLSELTNIAPDGSKTYAGQAAVLMFIIIAPLPKAVLHFIAGQRGQFPLAS